MTAALEGMSGQQHAPAALYPRERPGTHFTGGWVGPRTGGKSRPHRDSIPDRPARSQPLHRLSYPAHGWNQVLHPYWIKGPVTENVHLKSDQRRQSKIKFTYIFLYNKTYRTLEQAFEVTSLIYRTNLIPVEQIIINIWSSCHKLPIVRAC